MVLELNIELVELEFRVLQWRDDDADKEREWWKL